MHVNNLYTPNVYRVESAELTNYAQGVFRTNIDITAPPSVPPQRQQQRCLNTVVMIILYEDEFIEGKEEPDAAEGCAATPRVRYEHSITPKQYCSRATECSGTTQVTSTVN